MKSLLPIRLIILLSLLSSTVSAFSENHLSAACSYRVEVISYPQTSCSNPNGEMEAFVLDSNGQPVDGTFSFDWYTAEGSYIGMSARVGNLPAGMYYVEVSDHISACTYTGYGVVNEETPQISIDLLSKKDISNCGEASGSEISIAIIEGGAQHLRVDWYLGTGPDPSMILSKWTNILTVTDLSAGFYTVQASDAPTGCTSAPLTIEIIDNSEEPLVTASLTPNTACEAALSNGSIHLQNTPPSSGTEPAAGYVVDWFYGDGTVVEAEKKAGYGLQGMPAGTYTAVVTHPETSCQSTTSFLINELLSIPELALSSQPNTVCNPDNVPNGSYSGAIQAELVLDGQVITNLGDFALSWYRLKGGEASLLETNQALVLEHLAAGTYLVQAKHLPTGCTSASVNIVLEDEIIVPELSASTSPVHSCDPEHPDGSVSFLADGQNTGYTFILYKGTAVVETEKVGEGTEFLKLPAGQYTVQATANNTGCTSAPLTVEIEDVSGEPLVTATLTPNTSCEATLSNGSIQLHISTPSPGTEPAAGYVVDWFYENGTAVEAAKRTGDGLEGIPAGTYRAVVTHPETSCQSTASFTIEEILAYPELVLSGSEANTVCEPSLATGGTFTGAIQADLIVGGQAVSNLTDYELSWYSLSGGETSLLETTNSLRLEELAAGTYQVHAKHLLTGCVSKPLTVEVEDATEQTEITLSKSPLRSCDPKQPDGSVSFLANGTTSGYTFSLYKGTAAAETEKIGEGAAFGNLPAGEYLVRALQKETGCEAGLGFTIEEELSYPAAPVTSDAAACEAASLSLAAEGVEVSQGYDFYWYGEEAGGSPIYTGSSLTQPFSETTTYYVSAVNEYGCESTERSPVTAFIYDLLIPQLEADGNRLFISLEGDYTYRWYLNGELVTTAGPEIIAEQEGTYEVEISNQAGCSRLSEPYEFAFTVSALNNESFDKTLLVYPNPFRQHLLIEFISEGAAVTEIKLSNQQMKQLKKWTFPAHQQLHRMELADLPQGVYILEIKRGEEVFYRRVARQ